MMNTSTQRLRTLVGCAGVVARTHTPNSSITHRKCSPALTLSTAVMVSASELELVQVAGTFINLEDQPMTGPLFWKTRYPVVGRPSVPPKSESTNTFDGSFLFALMGENCSHTLFGTLTSSISTR